MGTRPLHAMLPMCLPSLMSLIMVFYKFLLILLSILFLLVVCPDPFIIVGTDRDDLNFTKTEILSRTYDGAVTEVNNYTHILVIQPDPAKPRFFTMSDSASAQPALTTMVNETFLLSLPPGLTVSLFLYFWLRQELRKSL